jgi:hypothetical protein
MLVILILLFVVKHFIADYLLQLNGQSGEKRKPGFDGLIALFTHSAYHGFLTYGVVCIYVLFTWVAPVRYISLNDVYSEVIYTTYLAFGLGLIDMVSHFGIDFAKIVVEKRNQEYINSFRWGGSNYSTSHGLAPGHMLLIVDQFLHTVIYLILIAILTHLAGVG